MNELVAISNGQGEFVDRRYIRDGKVAVLISGSYGAGWSTWNKKHTDMLFDPEIVQLVLVWEEYDRNAKGYGHDYERKYAEFHDTVDAIARSRYVDCYTGGISGLYVEWVPIGDKFRVHEYDGSETLKLESNEKWIVA